LERARWNRHSRQRAIMKRENAILRDCFVCKGVDTREMYALARVARGVFALALAGDAPRGAQFALLNSVRNTDIFFIGRKKIRPVFSSTAMFKGMVVLPSTNASERPCCQVHPRGSNSQGKKGR